MLNECEFLLLLSGVHAVPVAFCQLLWFGRVPIDLWHLNICKLLLPQFTFLLTRVLFSLILLLFASLFGFLLLINFWQFIAHIFMFYQTDLKNFIWVLPCVEVIVVIKCYIWYISCDIYIYSSIPSTFLILCLCEIEGCSLKQHYETGLGSISVFSSFFLEAFYHHSFILIVFWLPSWYLFNFLR